MPPERTSKSPDLLDRYDPDGWYCELLGRGRANQTREIQKRPKRLVIAALRKKDAEREHYNLGITFTVYSDPEDFSELGVDVSVRSLNALEAAS